MVSASSLSPVLTCRLLSGLLLKCVINVCLSLGEMAPVEISVVSERPVTLDSVRVGGVAHAPTACSALTNSDDASATV